MKNSEINEVSMFVTVITYSGEYKEITVTIPNFSENETKLKNTVERLDSYSTEQQGSDKWINEIKLAQENELIVTTVDYARKLSAYGRFTNNIELQAEMKINSSRMNQSANSIKRDLAKLVYDRAQAHIAQLGSYGITAETQQPLLKLINSYSESITIPNVARAHKEQDKQLKALLFKDAYNALANMDAGAEIVRLKEPAFYNGYRTARKVINRGKGSLALKVTITDAATGEAVKGATITITANEKLGDMATAQTAVLVKRSAAKGGVYLKSLAEGEYTVTISKNGYVEHSVMVNITSGERSSLKVALRRK